MRQSHQLRGGRGREVGEKYEVLSDSEFSKNRHRLSRQQ